MELTNEEIDRAEAQILRELDAHPGQRRPRDVIDAIRREHGSSDSVLRAAIWYLIDRNIIDLTTDLRVQRIGRPPSDRGALVS